MVSSDGTSGCPDCKVLAGLKHADPSPPSTHPLPPPPCAALGLRPRPAGRPGRPTAAAAGRGARGRHARPCRRLPRRPVAARGGRRRAGQPAGGQRRRGPGGCSSSAPPARGGARARGSPGPGPRARGRSAAFGRRSSSPGSARLWVAGPGTWKTREEGREEGAGAGHCGPTHPAPPLESSAVLEPLPLAVLPRPAPAATSRTCSLARRLHLIRTSLRRAG